MCHYLCRFARYSPLSGQVDHCIPPKAFEISPAIPSHMFLSIRSRESKAPRHTLCLNMQKTAILCSACLIPQLTFCRCLKFLCCWCWAWVSRLFYTIWSGQSEVNVLTRNSRLTGTCFADSTSLNSNFRRIIKRQAILLLKRYLINSIKLQVHLSCRGVHHNCLKQL